MAEKIQYHWQLDVYKLSVEAAMETYELSKSFTKDEVKAQKFRPETDGTGMILLAN